MPDESASGIHRLQDLSDDSEAERLSGDPLELLRCRSNLLVADLRVPNAGGGHASARIDLPVLINKGNIELATLDTGTFVVRRSSFGVR